MKSDYGTAELSPERSSCVSSIPTMPGEERKKTKIVFLIMSLAASQYFTFQSAFILSSFYPRYCQARGISGLLIGFIMGITQVVAIIAVYAQVGLMNYVSPKNQLVCGLFITGLTSLAFGFTDQIADNTIYIWTCIALRLVQGLGIAATDLSVFVIANVETPMKHLSTAMGVLEALLSVSIAIAAPLGGALYKVDQFYIPFAVSGSLCLVQGVFMTLFLSKKDHNEEFTVCGLLSKTFAVSLIPFLYHMTLFGSLVGFFGGMIEPHLRKFNLTPAAVGGVILSTTGVQAITYPVWGLISDKTRSYNTVLFIGYGLILCGLVLFGPIPGLPKQLIMLPIVIVSLVLCGAGVSAMSISTFLLCKIQLLKSCPSENMASSVVSAAYVGFADMGVMVGEMVGGTFIDYIGYRNGAALWALLVLLGIFLQIIFNIIAKRNDTRKIPQDTLSTR